LRGAVLVGKDADGNPVLVDTGNRLGRRGAAWGAGAGLAIGLFSPALLAAAFGAATAAGAVAGTFADHRIKSGLADKIGQALAAGSGAIIAVTPSEGRLAVEQACAGSPMKSVAELSRSTLRSLGAAPEEAMGKFNPTAPGCRYRNAASAAPSVAPWLSRSATGRSFPGPRRPTAHRMC
jgi:Protein of unknown function (DUF1269)